MRTSAAVAISLVLAVVTFLGGTWYAGRKTLAYSAGTVGQRILYYACPMHPQYRSDKSGDCVSCGMRLEPVYAGGSDNLNSPVATGPEGNVRLSGARQQLLGVRVEAAQRTPFANVLRLPGRVAVDEQRLHRIIAAVDGWIRDLGPNSAGVFVKEKETLGSYYAPNLIGAQQSFLVSLTTTDQLRRADVVVSTGRPSVYLNVQVAIDALRNLGMEDRQIEELEQTKAIGSQINIYSPITGFVLDRSVSPGQRFEKGSELYRIADISRVWVMADIFEKDLDFVKAGAPATVRYRGHEFHTRVSNVLPRVAPDSRVLKVRFEVDNQDYTLKPEAFVDVEMPVSLPAAISVPVDAVIDSGLTKTVFVAQSGGYFEPRSVETGWRFGDRVEIVKGLTLGEQIVVSGNFLLDSESRMRMTAGQGGKGMGRQGDVASDPVCGMEVDPAKAAARSEYQGKTYYFCSDQCKRGFDSHPAAVLAKRSS